jgi:methylated-DNA-[protein]-cysteine S-methyltransferase
MEKAIINTPLGITEIQGDENGISKIYIRDEDVKITSKIPSELKEAVIQLQEYFEGKEHILPFCYIHQELNFKKKYGKNYSISLLEKHVLI